MNDAQAEARVTVRTLPLWRLRLARSAPRWLIHALATAGIVSSLRFAIAPPRPVIAPQRASPAPDLAAEGFATLFARDYLTWSGSDPEARSAALAPFTGPTLERELGMHPPQSGSETVLWAQVVGERSLGGGEHVYVVAAGTEKEGVLYLAVPVLRRSDGALSLAGYPAFVGAPSSAEADLAVGEGAEVEEPALSTVVSRALRNYLAPSPSELAADLTEGAEVSTPQMRLRLESVQSLVWARGGGDVVATVLADGEGGAQYTLTYELGVERVAGRWEISAIETG